MEFVSLQKAWKQQHDTSLLIPFVDGQAQFDASMNFSDTAAVAAVRLIISTDSGIVHLAGGLGRPTWVAVGTEWRWLLEGDRTPWYKTCDSSDNQRMMHGCLLWLRFAVLYRNGLLREITLRSSNKSLTLIPRSQITTGNFDLNPQTEDHE